MALIQCPECNGSVSDSASTCPHCGYPIAQYVKENSFDEEVKRLTDKIKQIEFTCPEPRLKVCIKCGCPFFYTHNVNINPESFDKPLCECGFPGTEIDYPQQEYVNDGGLGVSLYIAENELIPRNIGDKESEEYQSRMIRLRERIREVEIDGKDKGELGRVKKIPPDPKYFGVYASTEPLPTYTPKPKPQLPHCPFCSSTNLTKLSSAKKATKIYFFGIFGMDDVGKTYKCNNCGGKF